MAKSKHFMFKWLLYSHCLLGPEVPLGDSFKSSEVWVWPLGGELMANIKREFYILVTVHLGIILKNNQLDAQFFLYIFISIPYMFRATSCSSSGESIVSMQHLVPTQPAYRTVTYTQWHIPDVVLIQLTLLMMSTRLLETWRESK
jgi:hypothetical protein